MKIRIGDLVAGTPIPNRTTVSEQKANRLVRVEPTADVRATSLAWLEQRGSSTSDYLFPSRVNSAERLSVRQYAWLVARRSTVERFAASASRGGLAEIGDGSGKAAFI